MAPGTQKQTFWKFSSAFLLFAFVENIDKLFCVCRTKPFRFFFLVAESSSLTKYELLISYLQPSTPKSKKWKEHTCFVEDTECSKGWNQVPKAGPQNITVSGYTWRYPYSSKAESSGCAFECSISILKQKFGVFIWFSHCWAIFQLDGQWLFAPAIFRPSQRKYFFCFEGLVFLILVGPRLATFLVLKEATHSKNIQTFGQVLGANFGTIFWEHFLVIFLSRVLKLIPKNGLQNWA